MTTTDHSSRSSDSQPRILVTGDLDDSIVRAAELDTLPGVRQVAIDELESSGAAANDAPWDLMVVVQATPRRFHSNQLARLQQLGDPAPLVVLCGAWYEGQRDVARTGITKVAWYHWPAWWQRTRARWFAGEASVKPSSPGRPLGNPQTSAPGRILVDTPYRAVWEMYAAGFAAIGRPSAWLASKSTSDCDAAGLVVDGSSWNSWLEDRVRSARRRCGQLPWIVALGFPRDADLRAARQMGAGGILAKPFELATLAWCADQWLRTS
jgi:hypothetical protein